MPADSAALIAALREGPTNAGWQGRVHDARIGLSRYREIFASLPEDLRTGVIERWERSRG